MSLVVPLDLSLRDIEGRQCSRLVVSYARAVAEGA